MQQRAADSPPAMSQAPDPGFKVAAAAHTYELMQADAAHMHVCQVYL